MHPPGRMKHIFFLLGPITTWKVDATITKLGWTTYMTPFSKWPPAKWNYVFACNSASRVDRDKMRSYLVTWKADILHSWAGINGPWNHRGLSLPAIIVYRGPAVTQSKSQLVDVMNEVWCSDAFAPKFVLREVLSVLQGHNYLLESDDGITINRDIWSCMWTRKRHISVMPCNIHVRKSRVMTQYVSIALILSDMFFIMLHNASKFKITFLFHTSDWYIFKHSLIATPPGY